MNEKPAKAQFIHIGESGCTKNGWTKESVCIFQPVEDILNYYEVDRSAQCRHAYGVPENCKKFVNYFKCSFVDRKKLEEIRDTEAAFSLCAQNTGATLDEVRKFAEIMDVVLDNLPPFGAQDRNYRAAESLQYQLNFFRGALLEDALEQNNGEHIKEIIEEWGDLNQWAGIPPLTQVALKGSPELLKLLLKKGARVDTMDPKGNTALSDAAFSGHLASVHELLAAHPNVDLQNLGGWTPLNRAADRGHLDVVQILVQAGANPETPNHEGFTPLAQSIWQGQLDVVNYLFTLDVSPFTAGKDGRTITDLAMYPSNPRHKAEILRVLKEYEVEYRKRHHT